MNPLLIIGALIAAALMLAKKSTPKTTAPAASVVLPTATAPGKVTIDTGTPSKVLTPPVVVQVPSAADYPARAASNPDVSLTYEEQQSLESDLPDDLYREAMASNHQVYVAAAAAVLAARGDTRSGDLTLRVANWKS